MYKKIICAGFGGQGIMVMGKLLARAAMDEKKEVVWMPSYGAEVRGGTAHSKVVISDTQIASGLFLKPDDCIIMNRPSFLKFENLVAKGGTVIINSSLINDELKREDVKVIRIPATETAGELGNSKVANMVALGAYQGVSGLVSLNSLCDALKLVLPLHRHGLIDINIQALKKGAELVNECSS
ncbi:MAG: 2-oxoacid:acceptor oxidoreductase family protein [Candidatus Omnitrophica bacterium]|nr:2-oxoacid:acceptor oxidoreductase family protein [Candidatus Omnitrophota bacterium]